MTPVKPQISKFHADKSLEMGFNMLRRLYSRAFLKRVKSFVHVCLLSVCMYCYFGDLLVTCLEEKT
jgi:hypothetical protein